MEEANFALQAIATVGFPIVMCVGLLAMLYIVMKDHKDETEQLKKSIMDCTLAIQALTEYIKGRDA